MGVVLAIGWVCAFAQTPTSTQPHPTPASSTTAAKAKLRPFMGRVLHDNSGYVLKAGDLEYKLDDADAVRSYNGRNVKIMGSLDRPTNTIHVEKIEPSM
jgi:Protein of unknown function (DUF5818)